MYVYIYNRSHNEWGSNKSTAWNWGFGIIPSQMVSSKTFRHTKGSFFTIGTLGPLMGWYTQLGFSNHHSWYLITITLDFLDTVSQLCHCVRSTAPQWAPSWTPNVSLWPRSRADAKSANVTDPFSQSLIICWALMSDVALYDQHVSLIPNVNGNSRILKWRYCTI